MPIVAKLDELGRPAWIALMVLGFVAWWPAGLAILAFIIGSGRMSCWNHHGWSHHGWSHHGMDHWQRKIERLQQKMDRMRNMAPGAGESWWGQPRSSGNRAFDEYRIETLRRLEQEQQEFRDFLDRLRHARDKAEFDEFMAERRNHPEAPPEARPSL
jgi:hypothetical protein